MPTEFARALRSIDELQPRTDVAVRRIAAPEGLAPHAVAFAATASQGAGSGSAEREDDEGSPGTARLVILFDPPGQEGWSGPFRIVAYFQAPLEAELAEDALLPDVAWSWLTDALDARGAAHDEVSGTVTRVLSRGFGELATGEDRAHVEIRASWSPDDSENMGLQVASWADALALLAGLPPAGEEATATRDLIGTWRRRRETS